MIKEAIGKLANREDLTYDEAEQVMDEIMGGTASDIQKSAYLMAMSMKGETIDEITASAAGMRKHCVKLLHDEDVLEIVGTGGDKSNSFNISTTSSFVVAAAGIPVAKHGNRAASSKSGAADVLEALGVNITNTPEKTQEILKKIGICFLFAQNYHIAMKYVAPVRRSVFKKPLQTFLSFSVGRSVPARHTAERTAFLFLTNCRTMTAASTANPITSVAVPGCSMSGATAIRAARSKIPLRPTNQPSSPPTRATVPMQAVNMLQRLSATV